MGFQSEGPGLVKDQLAAKIREEILNGRLEPGSPIVEIRWAKKLGVGQTSIREALNILISEGYVEKLAGQSARVTEFSLEDLHQIQVLRTHLESLAVRLVTAQHIDLSELEQAYADMASAAKTGNMRALIERDLRFHLLLFELSGNRFLHDAGKRILVPLFAFTMVRVLQSGIGPKPFIEGLPEHEHILEAIRAGDPEIAEQQIVRAMDNFARLGQGAWSH